MQLVVGDVDGGDLEAFAAQFRAVFPRHGAGARSGTHDLLGRLSDLPRKNAARMAEVLPATTLEQLRRFLVGCPRAPTALDAQRLRLLVAEGWTDPERGVLSLDDTGLPERGRRAVGVQRQSRGEPGKTANRQVVVTARYADPRSHRPVGTRPSLPRSWVDAADRLTKARVPPDLAFAAKPELALGLLDRARAAGVAPRVGTAAPGSGDGPACLAGLEERAEPYAVQVGLTFGTRAPAAVRAAPAQPPPPPRRPVPQRRAGRAPAGPHARAGRPRTHPHPVAAAPLVPAAALTAAVPAEDWQGVTVLPGDGSALAPAAAAEPARQRRACRVRVHRGHGDVTGPVGWLLGERPLPGERGDAEWYFAWGLDEVAPAQHLRWARSRWAIARLRQGGTQGLGPGDCRGRTWPGRPRHLAPVCPVWRCARLRAAAESDPPEPAASSPHGAPAAGAAAGAGGARRRDRPSPLPRGHSGAHPRRRPVPPPQPFAMTPK